MFKKEIKKLRPVNPPPQSIWNGKQFENVPDMRNKMNKDFIEVTIIIKRTYPTKYANIIYNSSKVFESIDRSYWN